MPAESHQSPTLELVRAATDRAVLTQLFDRPFTRAELATATGISKPTASESIRRLTEAGLVCAAGRQVGGRGRSGTYCRLRADAAAAVAVHAGPDGVVAETIDPAGAVLARQSEPVQAPVEAAQLRGALRRAVRAAVAVATGPVLVTAVSIADPVDRNGRLVPLPGSPFVTGGLDPRAALRRLPIGRLVVDNDVNWAARAERTHGCAGDLDDFVHLYLGAGIGAGLVLDGQVRRGHRGLAGEAAYLLTRGPGGRSMPLLDCFGAWRLTQPGTTAIDTDRMQGLLSSTSAAAARRRDAVGAALAGMLASLCAALDPGAVVLAGPWGALEPTRALLHSQLAKSVAGDVGLRTASTGSDGPLIGVRHYATQAVRAHLLEQL